MLYCMSTANKDSDSDSDFVCKSSWWGGREKRGGGGGEDEGVHLASRLANSPRELWYDPTQIATKMILVVKQSS